MKIFLMMATGLMFIAMCLNGISKVAWMNMSGQYVRWEKPTTIILDGLPIYNVNHSSEDLEKAGYLYIADAPDCNISDMSFDYQNGTIKALTAEEKEARYQALFIFKDPFIIETEKAYTNLLTQVGLPGVWSSYAYTYQQVGLYMMGNNLTLEMLLADKLYNILLDYYGLYGGTDLRVFPWGSPYISSPDWQE